MSLSFIAKLPFYHLSINIEWISGDSCIKYVLKYVMKGTDLAFVAIRPEDSAADPALLDYDEFKQIQMARYQTANEAILGILGTKHVRKSHLVLSFC